MKVLREGRKTGYGQLILTSAGRGGTVRGKGGQR